jgi:phage-related protein
MAEAPTMEVRARLTAETAQFTRGMEQARRSTEQLTNTSTKLRSAMVGLGVGFGAAGVALITFSRRAFDAAARVEELDVAMQAVGHSTGIGYEALNEAALAIKANGIEMEIAQKTALKFAQNNLELAKAADVARVAQDLAVIGALNSTDAFDRLTHAIVTGRSEVLKSVGIQKSAGRAYAEYAASIGKAAKDLSYTEKQTAVMNMVIAEGARVAGTYEASMTTAGKVLRSYARLHNELGVAVGAVLLKAFGPLIYETYETYKAFIKALGAGGAFKDTLTAIQTVLVKITTPVTNFVKGLRDKITALNQAKISIVGLADQMEIILPVIAAVGAGFATFAGRDLLRNLPILGNFFQGLRVLPVAMVAMILTSAQMRAAIGKLFQALSPLLPPLIQLGKIASTIAGYGIAILAKAIEGVAIVISGIIGFVQSNINVFKTLAIVVGAVAAGYAAFRLQIFLVSAALAIQQVALIAYQGITALATGGIAAMTRAFQALSLTMAFNPIGLVIGAIVALVIAFAAAWKNSEKFRDVMSRVFNFVAKIVGKVIGGVLRAFGNLLIAYGYLISTNNAFGQVIAAVFQFVWETILNVFIGIVKGIKFVVDGFISLMDNNTILAQIVEFVFNFIIKTILTWYKFVLGAIRNVLSGFVELMESHGVLRRIVENVFNTIIQIIAFAVTSIIVTLANIIKAVASVVYVFQNLLSVVKTIVSGIVQGFGIMASAVGNLLKAALSFIVEKFLVKLVEKVKDFVNFLAGAAARIPIVGSAISGFFSGMSTQLTKAEEKLRKFGETANNIGASEVESSKTSISAITKVSKTLIEKSKSWGNYSEGAAGALSNIANKMLDFNSKVVGFAEKNNGASIVETLISGAKKALPVLDNILGKIDDALQVNFGKAVVDTLVKGAKLASDGLGKMLTEMEKLKEIKVGEFIVDKASEAAIKAGEFLIGLATGIESFTESGFVDKLGDAFDGLTDKLKTALGFGNILEDEKKKLMEFTTAPGGTDDDLVNNITKQSDLMKRIREAMLDGIQSMKDVLQDLKDAAKDFADSLKDTILGFAGLKGVELPDGFIPKAKSLIENMRMRLDKTQQFSQQIASLQAMGLDAGALQAIIEEGPIKGAQLAASILGGGLEAIQQVSDLQRQISFAGAAIGQYGADVAFGGMIASATQRVSDLESAEFAMRSRGNNVVIEQGAFVVNVDTTGAADDEERANIITRRIQETFAILAKELAAK